MEPKEKTTTIEKVKERKQTMIYYEPSFWTKTGKQEYRGMYMYIGIVYP